MTALGLTAGAVKLLRRRGNCKDNHPDVDHQKIVYPESDVSQQENDHDDDRSSRQSSVSCTSDTG